MPETSRYWQLLGASVTGQAHLERGTGNQDALAAATTADGRLCLAVADGAGSASRSDEGARTATETAIAALASASSLTARAALDLAFSQAVTAVTALARRSGSQPREFACTLLLVLVTADEVAALQLGDGAVIAEQGGSLRRLTPVWRSDYVGETMFITSPGARQQAVTVNAPAADLSALALLTDGLEPVATDLQSGEPFAPFFTPLFSFTGSAADQALRNRQLEELLGSERVRSRTHDDTTLLLAVRSSR